MIEILEYINSRKVVHNDIKPDNMFLRGSDVFIGGKYRTISETSFTVLSVELKKISYVSFLESNFDCEYACGHTAKYASSSIFTSPPSKRYERYDLESLVYTTWFRAGCDSLRSDDYELFQSKTKGEAKTKMMVSFY